jgi:uncharacterized membrane protein
MGEHNFAKASMALYGIILMLCAIAYNILQKKTLLNEGKNSVLAKALEKDIKGKASIVLYFIGIVFSFLMNGFLVLSIYWSLYCGSFLIKESKEFLIQKHNFLGHKDSFSSVIKICLAK